MKRFVAVAVLLLSTSLPTRAGAMPLSFDFVFGQGADLITGRFTGDFYDFSRADPTWIPAGSNWMITELVFTSMPTHMTTVYGRAGGLNTNNLPDPIDWFRPAPPYMYINHWTVIGGAIVSGALGMSQECVVDCVVFRMNYDYNVAFGLLFAADADLSGILDEDTVSGSLIIQAVPEPATLTLVTIGLAAAGLRRRLRTSARQRK